MDSNQESQIVIPKYDPGDWYEFFPMVIGTSLGLLIVAPLFKFPLIWSGLLIGVILGLVILYFVAVFLLTYKDQKALLASIKCHDLDGADDLITKMESTFGLPKFQYLCARINRGVILIYRKRFVEALAIFEGNLKFAQMSRIRVLLLCNCAECYLLQGKTVEAAAFLNAARKIKYNPMVIVIDVMLHLRQELYPDALRLLEQNWQKLAGAPHAEINMKHAWLFRALALERADANQRTDEIRDLLGGARPFVPGEYDFLGAEWPEMKEFLLRHEFTDAAA